MENYFNKSRNSKCSSCYTSHKTLGNSVGHRHSGQTGRKQLLPSNIISGKKKKQFKPFINNRYWRYLPEGNISILWSIAESISISIISEKKI